MLNGVHLCEGFAVATDGLKLAYGELEYKGQAIIIPAETVRQIPDIDGKVSVSDRQIIIDGESCRFSSNLIEQKYPEWQRFIPKDFKWECSVNSGELIEALKTAQLGGESVRVEATNGEIVISNQNAETVVGAEFEGEFTGAYFAQYLIDAANAAGTDSLSFQVGSGRGEALINGHLLVMPVKL